MSEIQGTVKEIFQGKVASGYNAGDAFYSITLEENPDEKLTIFEEDERKGWIDGVEQGKEYTFTVTKKGKYINITGKTIPCIGGDEGAGQVTDRSGDMREDSPQEQPHGKPVKVTSKPRKKVAVTSTAGDERVFKNKISALSLAVEYICATDPTVKETELMECAERFYTWISG